MARIGEKGTDILTVVHKIVALAWAVSAVVALIRAFSAANSANSFQLGPASTWGMMLMAASGVTVLIGILYGIFTNYGFIQNRWVAVKWILTLASVIAVVVVVRGACHNASPPGA